MPAYQIFYYGEDPPEVPKYMKKKTADDIAWGSQGKNARFFERLRGLLAKG
jgi:hypothetical protein